MASSSLGSSIPAPEAVQLLVSSLADDSSVVREASMASLRDIASLNPLLVLDCCYAVSRGGRRRFGNMAGVFQVMAFSVGALEKGESDSVFMGKLAKIATAEIISSKELNADWQRQASGLLVSIGTHFPDLMMEEIFLHLSGPATAAPAMVQILADFASSDALQFTPRLKGVLSKVSPILGNVRDIHRPIFANAFKCWSQAVWLYITDLTSDSPLDSDVMSFLNSVFELLLRVWAVSRDHKVRVSTVDALGQMVGLITRTQLKSALPRLIPAILELYKKDHDDALLATCSLHNLLNASLLSESGPPLLDFEDLTIVLSTLLPVIGINNERKRFSDISVGRKTYNEVQRCFLTVGLVYPEDLFTFLLNKCKLKEDPLTFGALCILKHLLPRLFEAWHSKRPLLVDTASSLLDEQSLAVRKALSELIVVMASHCYLVGPSGELFVEYLVRHSAIGESDHLKAKGELVSPTQLRAVCGKGLLLLTVTIPEMEYILWPFLLKMIIPKVYTGAVASVCRCITELCRRRSSTTPMLIECKARADIPNPEELFTRLVVLLHNPLAKEQLASQILTVLGYLSPLFPKNISMFWQDEIPKMKAYVYDTEDLKLDPTYQETWDDMIINFLAESLDVTQDADWVISLGNSFAKQYILYAPDDDHAALLHRCIGILLQKVNDRAYVRDKIDWMYEQADISIPANRLGLAKAMGLVAASHLDTVLEKLKIIVDNVGQSIFQRILSLFSESYKTEDSDDIHAALALMYGYAAKYAPSSVIEARIDALVGTNMLSRLLHVRQQTAKQAVITAIDLLGRAVINAAETGATFPLKRRDQMLDYILTLMGRDENEGFAESSLEVLHTQALALNACTTLVSVEPKLTIETRNRVMKATLGFFALPNDPSDVISPLIDNLVTLLCAILLTSGEDGRSRAEQLLHLLRQLDQYVSSPIDYQRKRGCVAVHEMLLKFRKLCVGGYCALGCSGDCPHRKYADRSMQGNFSNLPSVFLFPDREVLCLGDRVITYLPRCADTNSEVRKISAQILDQFFSISLSLPKAVLTSGLDSEDSYKALSSLEDVIAILKSDASIDPSEVFNRIVSSICSLLTEHELVAALHSCTAAICDKIRQSAEGAIQAVTEFVSRRGSQLSDNDISRTTHSLLSAAVHITDKNLRVEAIGAISALAENTQSSIVFNEVLATAGKDIVTKDITRMRGGWPMQDAFYAFSQHTELSVLFMEHLISILNRSSLVKSDSHKGENTSSSSETHVEDDILQAAIFALTAFFRGGGKIGKKAVEKSYSSVVGALTLQLGSCHGLASSGQQDPLRVLLTSFQAFCECVGDLEMGKILARNGEQIEKEKWVGLIGDIAGCISIKRPKEVRHICMILTKALNRPQRFQREAAAAALSEFIWVSEINRFTPNLEVLRYVGDKYCRLDMRKSMYDHVKKSSKGHFLPFDVLLTTYDIALVDQDFLSQIPWQYAIIDEAQRLKNPNSVLYNVLLEQFLIPRRLLITGTPIQNNLTELWALMHFCMPLVFGTLDQFLSAFKETGDGLSGLDVSNDKETYKSLKFILGAFMLRRTKSLLIESGNLVLPPLTELTVMVPLVSLQKKIYTSILRKELPGLLELSSGGSNHTSLQNIVIQLRKACSHPYLFPGIEPEPFEEGEHLVQASGKLLVLDQLLKRLHDSGHRVLLFSQMTSTLDILQDFMELRRYSYERLDGSVRAEERFAAIKNFSAKTERGLDSEVDGSNAFVFMISTRAGGVGLNLVAADTVIFYEQDWNPQVDKQALQRAHRIGQISHVLSINLVTEHSVEEVILRRAERKLQLSHNVVGDNMEEKEEDGGDLRSLVFGLQRFDPEEIHNEESDNLKMVEISSLAEKVVAIRQNVEPDKEERRFEINSSDTLLGNTSSASLDSELDEASYLSWVEKLKEAARSSKDEKIIELGNRKNLSEERNLRIEAARKKAEEKKLATWGAHGYQSLSVEEPILPDDVDSSSDAGSVNFVFGDCTNPSTVSHEPAIIFSCVDDSGNWGRGGMFDALSKLSNTVPTAYHRASEFKDLHLGDLHLIKIDDNDDQQNTQASKPLWVAVAVTQSYNSRRKVPRSSISIPDLESCLAKASFSASQKSASLHMPRIGYQDGSDRSQWYTVERLLRKYSSIFTVKIFVYYYRRSP